MKPRPPAIDCLSQPLELLSEQDVQAAIRNCLGTSTSARLAVAFWGSGARKRLGLAAAQDVKIVCNLKMGGTNPHEIRAMVDEGRDVRQCDDLHAKVYLFDEAVIIGSSNASTNGLGVQDDETKGWRELNILIRDPEIVQDTLNWYNGLSTRPISALDIERALAIWELRRQVPVPSESKSLLSLLRQSPTAFDGKSVFLVVWSKDMDQEGKDALEEAQVRFGSNLVAFQGWPSLPAEGHLICFERRPRGRLKPDGPFWRRRSIPADIHFGEDDSLQLIWPQETILGLTLPKEDEAAWEDICQSVIQSDRWDAEDGTAFVNLSDLARTFHKSAEPLAAAPQTAGKNRIHFICKSRLGIAPLDAKSGIYTSEEWLLTRDEVSALSGGEVIFHETKATLSYFGGTILDARPMNGGEAENGRIRWMITLQSRAECKGLSWDLSGLTHGMAWTSGVVPLRTLKR